MAHFYVNSEQLLNYVLTLQRINSVSLPFAVQGALNSTTRDVKKRTLKISTNKHFNIKKRTFFTANSGYKPYKAKQFNYNVNRLRAEVGITKGTSANEKATEQVGNQQTATRIKRSINPLGEKPQSKGNIDILSKKPEIYDSSQSHPEGNSIAYIRLAQRAYRNNSGFLVKGKGSKRGRGALNKVTSIKKRKPTKRDPRKMIIKTKSIASYIESGYVKLKTRHAFLIDASIMSQNQKMNTQFIKEAERQVELALKRRK